MISIHQSQFLPWPPYFYKILKSDIFIILDDVQYQKNGMQNRNTIKTPNGEAYLTVPVTHKSHYLINEVTIANKLFFSKMLKTLKSNYSKARYFEVIFESINNLVVSKNYLNLYDFNNDLIILLLALMKIDTKIKLSSEFSLSSKKGDLVLDLILATKECNYIIGSGGLNYIDLDKFSENAVNLYQYKFSNTAYKQLWPKLGFIENLSIIDLLFNELETSKEYLLANGSLNMVKD